MHIFDQLNVFLYKGKSSHKFKYRFVERIRVFIEKYER